MISKKVPFKIKNILLLLFMIVVSYIATTSSATANSINSKSPVGIVDSVITRDILKNTNNTYDFTGADEKTHSWLEGKNAYLAPYGAYEVFEALGIPYKILGDSDLEDMRVLNQLKVLVLPRTLYISDTATENIAKWVGSGGILIGTEQVGIYKTSTGTERDEPILSSIFGIDYVGKVSKTNTSIFITNTNHPVWDAGYEGFGNEIFIGDETIEKNTETVSISVNGGVSIAEYYSNSTKFGEAVVVNTYGSGKTLYLAPSLFEYTIGSAQYHYDFMFDSERWNKHPYQQLGEETILIIKNFLENELNYPLIWTSAHPAGYNATLVFTHDCDGVWTNVFRDYAEAHNYTDTYWTRPNDCRRAGLSALIGTNQEHGDHFDSSSGLAGKTIYTEIVVWNSGNTLGYDKAITGGKHWNLFWYPESIDAMKYAYDNLPELIGLRGFHPGCRICIFYGKQSQGSGEPEYPGTVFYRGLGLRRPYRTVISEQDYVERLRGYDHTEYFEHEDNGVYKNDSSIVWDRYNGIYIVSFHTDHGVISQYGYIQQLADEHGSVWRRSYGEVVNFAMAVRSLQIMDYSQNGDSFVFQLNGNSLPSEKTGTELKASISIGPFSSTIKNVYMDDATIDFTNKIVKNKNYAVIQIDNLQNHVIKVDQIPTQQPINVYVISPSSCLGSDSSICGNKVGNPSNISFQADVGTQMKLSYSSGKITVTYTQNESSKSETIFVDASKYEFKNLWDYYGVKNKSGQSISFIVNNSCQDDKGCKYIGAYFDERTITTTTTSRTSSTSTTTVVYEPLDIGCKECEVGSECECEIKTTCEEGLWIVKNKESKPLPLPVIENILPIKVKYTPNATGQIYAIAICFKPEPTRTNKTTVEIKSTFLVCPAECLEGMECKCMINRCNSGFYDIEQNGGLIDSAEITGSPLEVKFVSQKTGDVEVSASCSGPVKLLIKTTVKIVLPVTTITTRNSIELIIAILLIMVFLVLILIRIFMKSKTPYEKLKEKWTPKRRVNI